MLRNLPGVTAARVVLVGLGKQSAYNAKHYASAEQAFANVLVGLRLSEGTSALLGVPVEGADLTDRARNGACAVGNSVYHYDATFGKSEREGPPNLKKLTQIV